MITAAATRSTSPPRRLRARAKSPDVLGIAVGGSVTADVTGRAGTAACGPAYGWMIRSIAQASPARARPEYVPPALVPGLLSNVRPSTFLGPGPPGPGPGSPSGVGPEGQARGCSGGPGVRRLPRVGRGLGQQPLQP